MKKKLLLLLGLIMVVNLCQAQIRKITGVITDGDGIPLPGASVIIKGTTNGVTTGTNGGYSISVNGITPVLVVKYLGFITQEVTVSDKTVINVTLKSASNELEQVVIGYAATPKRDLTGSVTTLDAAKQLKDTPVNDAAEALTGRLAGVQITGAEGSLESDPRIIIRGGGSITQDNSPLYIIDGIQVEDGLRSIAPQDIARIDVLKDASATAIYGSRGANGVVVITTKTGKVGTGTVNYNGLFGVSNLPESLPVMSPYEYVVYQYERFKNSASERRTFALRYNIQPEPGSGLPAVDVPNFAELERFKEFQPVDWQKEVIGNTGYSKTHNVSINGGTDKGTRYNLSYTNADQTGILLNTGLKRHLFNAKLNQTVSKKLKLEFSLRYTNTANDGASSSDAGNAQLNGLRNFVKYRPYLNPNEVIDAEEFNEEEYNSSNQGGGLGLLNPVAGIMAKYRKSGSSVTNLGGNLNYEIDKAFSIRSTIGVNMADQKLENFRQALRLIEFPSANFLIRNDKSLNQSNVLTYTNSKSKTRFSKNNEITALLGQEVYILESKMLNNSLRNYPKGITPELALTQLTQGESLPGFPNQDYGKSDLLSFFGRANYTYNGKYLAAFTMRADGSSKFAEGKRWGYFPSASLAWRISDEGFMKEVNWVNDVKLRLSYGASGNNRLRDYAFMSQFDASSFYGLEEALRAGYHPTALPNPALKWETTLQRNIGLDFSFLSNRVEGSIDFYSNRTNDVITNVAIPPATGYLVQLQNTADTRNKGVELQLSGQVLKAKKFSWNSDFNISFNKNTVVKLATGLESQEFDSGWASLNAPNEYLVQVGESVGNIFGFVNEGFYTVDDFNAVESTTTPGSYTYTLKPDVVNGSYFGTSQPGGIKIKDTNGDGTITAEDRQIIGNAVPLFFGGLNQQFSLGKLDASIFVNFSVGNDILNANKVEFTNGYNHNQNMSKIMENRWKVVDNQGVSLQSVSSAGVITGVAPEIIREANKDAKIWQPIRSTPGYYTTDFAVEDGSFLRLNNITVGYTFDSSLLGRIKVKRARIYATANNLAVITNYSGYDPEVNTRRASGLTPGVDYSAYPRSRNFVFGLNLSL